jgi:hypothetical protein
MVSIIKLPKIIAIIGAKRSGKDVIANYICKKLLYKKIAFADPLKDAVASLFDFSYDQIGYGGIGDEKDIVDDRWGITPRKALQFFGTEVMQYKIQELLPGIDRKFFAYTLISKIKSKNDKYVISDMRFLHEYEELKKIGVFVIRVDRPSVVENINLDENVHSSEIEYKNIPYDMHLLNDKGIDEFIENFDIELSKIFIE